MREILFRGKRLDNGEWVEGFLLKVIIDGKSAYLIFGDNFCFDGSNVKALSHALVDPATVGQFTGLVDKAGKMIFEGDIVSFGANVYVVKYIEKYSRFSGTMPGIVFSGFPLANSIVIGNIHDNSELWRTEK